PMRSLAAPLACGLFAALLAAVAAQQPAPAKDTALRFEVKVAPGLVDGPVDGRVLGVLGRGEKPEPPRAIGRTRVKASPLLGAAATGLPPVLPVVLDQTPAIFPLAPRAPLPAGTYAVQAVLARNPDLNLPDAPGNLYGPPTTITIDPAKGGIVALT